jgi:hypothetical protein
LVHQLRIELIKLRHELTNKNQTIGRLKFLCRERMTRIDDLNGKVEQSRQQIRRLDLQNQILIEMICRLASSITDAAKGCPTRGVPRWGVRMARPKQDNPESIEGSVQVSNNRG